MSLRLRAWMSTSVQTLTQCCLQESDRLFGVISEGEQDKVFCLGKRYYEDKRIQLILLITFVLSASIFLGFIFIVLLIVDVLKSIRCLIKTNVHLMFLQFHNGLLW